jgi:DNA-binding XRE family transcriptional regulator
MKKFATLIKEKRIKNNLTQREVAEECNISQGYLAAVEIGHFKPFSNITILKRLSTLLDISFNILIDLSLKCREDWKENVPKTVNKTFGMLPCHTCKKKKGCKNKTYDFYIRLHKISVDFKKSACHCDENI